MIARYVVQIVIFVVYLYTSRRTEQILFTVLQK